MTRAAFLLSLGSSAAPAQMLKMGEASEGFISLFNGRDLDQWTGDEQHWQAERGVLMGRSDGKSPSLLVLNGREYGDLDLRFDLRVRQGAGTVQLRGPGKGPLGVGLEVGTSVARWLVDGSHPLAVANVRPDEWNGFRIVSKDGRFDAFCNEVPARMSLAGPHLPPRGKLALVMPAGAPCEIAFRNVRVKEL